MAVCAKIGFSLTSCLKFNADLVLNHGLSPVRFFVTEFLCAELSSDIVEEENDCDRIH